MNKKSLVEIAKNDQLLEVGREAIEKALIRSRNCRLSTPFRGNGLIIKEKDGADSHVIRFGPETALRIGIEAIAKHLDKVR